MIHVDLLSMKEVLVGSRIAVTRNGVRVEHVLMPGLASYLVARYNNNPSITIESLSD